MCITGLIGQEEEDDYFQAKPKMIFPGCECGALKTYGFGPGAVGHSCWCPWSTDRVAIPWFCELPNCMNGAAHAFIDPSDLLDVGVHYYCEPCWSMFGNTWCRHWLVTPTHRQ